MCLRLNLSPVNLSPAWQAGLRCHDCEVSLIQVPFHRIHCKKESSNGRRVQHDHVNNTFATFARLCGHAVQMEPSGFLDPETQKRPDGFIRLNDGGNMLYDVRGFDSLAPSYINQEMSAVLAKASNEKLCKYQSLGKALYPNMQMHPVIFDTLSGPSDAAIRLMKSIAHKGHFSSSRNPSQIVHDAIASMSVAIQQDNCAIVMKSFEQARP